MMCEGGVLDSNFHLLALVTIFRDAPDIRLSKESPSISNSQIRYSSILNSLDTFDKCLLLNLHLARRGSPSEARGVGLPFPVLATRHLGALRKHWHSRLFGFFFFRKSPPEVELCLFDCFG